VIHSALSVLVCLLLVRQQTCKLDRPTLSCKSSCLSEHITVHCQYDHSMIEPGDGGRHLTPTQKQSGPTVIMEIPSSLSEGMYNVVSRALLNPSQICKKPLVETLT
jgi:hypothetical protein